MRCQALAQAMDSRGISVTFVVRPASEKLINSRQDWVGTQIVIPVAVALEDEPGWLSGCADKLGANVIVLDGYQFDLSYRFALWSSHHVFACFDDMNNLPELPCDLLINGSDSGIALEYDETAPTAIKCLGPDFRVLRQEFLDVESTDFEHREHLTLVFGGSDPLDLTLKLVHSLEQHGFKGKIRILTGAAYQKLTQLKHFLDMTQLDILHLHDCQNVANEFAQARLVVSAAGGTQFELLACACPSLLLVVADNQLSATKFAQQQGWCFAYDAREDENISVVTTHLISLWSNTEALVSMSEKASKLRVLNGANNIIKEIDELVRARSL